MYIDADEIKLDPQQNRIDIAEEDWAINAEEHLMRHFPTRIIFRIEMDEEGQKAGQGTAFNFIARPIHIGSGQQLPVPAAMTELGRSAIVLYLHAVGLFDLQRRQENVAPTCEPDMNVN
jgi:hypothetical protein